MVFKKEHEEGKDRGLARWLPDASGGAVLAGTVGLFVLLFGVLPHWLKGQEANDLRGAPSYSESGQVMYVDYTPLGQGGGGFFNAVSVAFGGRKSFYVLPRDSQWRPAPGDPVRVAFRVGTHSGLVHVDQVTPLPKPPLAGQPPLSAGK